MVNRKTIFARVPAGATGFTLLEILISLTLLSAMFVILTEGFNLSIRSWEAGERKIEAHYSVTEALNLIGRQLKGARKAFSTDVRTNAKYLAFSGEKHSMAFVTASPRVHTSEEAGGLYVQKITFDEKEKVLYFEEYLFDPWVSFEDGEGEKFKISEGRIDSLDFEYYVPEPFQGGPGSVTGTYVWTDSIDNVMEMSAKRGNAVQLFPIAVRMNLKTDDDFVWPRQIVPLYQDMTVESRVAE